MKTLSLIFLGLLLSNELYAEPIRYIRDTLYVPLRSGQGSQYRIVHKGLLSGARLELLETSADGTYSKVRTSKGKEGWLQTQYLMEQPAAKNLLAATNAKVGELQTSNRAMQKQLKDSQKAKQALEKRLQQVNASQSDLSQELEQIKDVSSRTIQINRDNNRLLQENEALKNQLDVISADNQRLQDKAASDSFMNGAFAVLIGVFITLLVPRLWPQKKTDWA